MRKNLVVRIDYGDFGVEVSSEGTSYSPDIIDDMVRRVGELWASACKTAVDQDLFSQDFADTASDDDDD